MRVYVLRLKDAQPALSTPATRSSNRSLSPTHNPLAVWLSGGYTVFERNRGFSHASLRLKLSTTRSRPQVPFLAPLAAWHPPPGSQWRAGRLMTTEQRRRLKKSLWDVGNASIVVAIALPTLLMVMWWLAHETMERDFLTPPEWTIRSRCYWHTIKAMQDKSVTGGCIPDWSLIGRVLERLLARLEDASIDGAKLRPISQAAEAGRAPTLATVDLSSIYDISAMPEPFRRAYFQAFMEAARTAEASLNILYDTTTRSIILRDWILGPSNPDPTPMPAEYAHLPAPREENCIQFFPLAEGFYKKLLATQGFNDRQRIESLLAYAEWLDGVGRAEDAEQQQRLALEIASSSLSSPESIIDPATGLVRLNPSHLTRNLLDVLTATAVHKACKYGPEVALSAMLSIFYAYRACPAEAPRPAEPVQSYAGRTPGEIVLARFIDRMLILLPYKPVEYPTPPASGNEPILRPASGDHQEARLAIYAAEVLAAASPADAHTALAWIKDALQIADAGVSDLSLALVERDRCNKCIPVALATWSSIIRLLKSHAPGRHGDSPPAWQHEQFAHQSWLKKVDRDEWTEKIEWAQWRLWAAFPQSTLSRVI